MMRQFTTCYLVLLSVVLMPLLVGWDWFGGYPAEGPVGDGGWPLDPPVVLQPILPCDEDAREMDCFEYMGGGVTCIYDENGIPTCFKRSGGGRVIPHNPCGDEDCGPNCTQQCPEAHGAPIPNCIEMAGGDERQQEEPYCWSYEGEGWTCITWPDSTITCFRPRSRK